MNSQGCGFGAVEKPIEERCEKITLDPHINLARNASFFLCDILPRICRGAVGYTTGGVAPKTGGVILFYDFSNTPTVKFMAVVFYPIKTNVRGGY